MVSNMYLLCMWTLSIQAVYKELSTWGGGVGWKLLSRGEGEKLELCTIIGYSKIILNRSKAAVKT